MQNKNKVEIKEFNNGCLRSTLLLMMLLLYSRLTPSRLVNVLVVSRLALAYVGRRRNSTMSPRRFNHMDISRKRETYGITNINSNHGEGPSNQVRTLRRTTSYVDDQDYIFVGFQDVVQTLLAELLKEEPHRSVLSIYGMGGLGKTTLARNLYNSPNIVSSFPTRAWICVSQEYNTMDLLKTIIKSIQGCAKETLDLLEKMVEIDLENHLRSFTM
ncbi:hypothetical protein H5410_020139 [Solanum commersonii]|uniref:NB-ARC domain-containing protein n=1 Tax=Solanum commersonii TaxID=4109 RepID=A0A9J5Z881_SOLCO|nr:hypothetical protein H5410_020139 [Solanum commersonii]